MRCVFQFVMYYFISVITIHCLLIQLQVIVWPHELVKSSVTLFSQDNNPLLSTETLKTYNKTVKQSKQSIAASDFEQFVP